MTVQTIEIHGERYVLLSERDFLALQSKSTSPSQLADRGTNGSSRFRDVTPVELPGTPASDILLRDQR